MSENETTPRAPQGEQTYVVVMWVTADVVTGWMTGEDDKPSEPVIEPRGYWCDLATVTVPPRTKRSVVIKKALAEAGIKPGDGQPPKVRALDVDSAEVHTPLPRQVEPEWVL